MSVTQTLSSRVIRMQNHPEDDEKAPHNVGTHAHSHSHAHSQTHALSSRDLSVYCLVAFVDLFAVSMIIPSLPAFIRSLDSGAVMFGFVNSFYGAIQLFSAPLAGSFSDIYGRRMILLVALVGTFVGYSCLSLSTTIYMVILSRIPCGLFKHTLDIVKLSITDTTSPAARASALGKLNASAGAGFIVGPALGGYISSFPNGFQWTATLTTVFYVINLGLVWTLFPRNKPHRKHEEERKPAVHTCEEGLAKDTSKSALPTVLTHDPESFRSVFFKRMVLYKKYLTKHSAARSMLITRMLLATAVVLFRSHYMLLLEDKYGAGADIRGYVLSYMGALGAITSAGVGRLLTWFESETRLVYISGLGLAASFALNALSTTLALNLVTLIPSSISISILRACTMSIQTKHLNNEEVGGFLGISNSLTAIAKTFSPLLSGWLIERSFSGPTFCAAAFALCSVFVFSRNFLQDHNLLRPRNETLHQT